MWLMTSADGAGAFLSIVKKDCRENELLVRARRSGDIARFLGQRRLECIVTTADYLVRAPIPVEALVDGFRTSLAAIQYRSYKDSVKDREVHNALIEVWHSMAKIQHPVPYSDLRSLHRYADRGGKAHEQR